jgi:hypothetical protein
MPANQFSPAASNGATPATDATATTRSRSSTAVASACGPPPEIPQVAKRSMPSASAIAATSPAALATVRPGWGDEAP